MNFFNQEISQEGTEEESFNFMESGTEGFNFGMDTFAPEGFGSFQANTNNNFNPNNFK